MSYQISTHVYRNYHQQQGLSLIELMIAMTLGLFLIWGVTQSFLTSRQVYAMQQGLSRIQENTRMAQEFLSYDIRNSGDYGCASGDSFVLAAADLRNAANCGTGTSPNIVGTSGINMITSTSRMDDNFLYAVYGFDNVAAGSGTPATLSLTVTDPAGISSTVVLNPAPKAGTDVLMVHVAREIGTLANSIPNGANNPPTLASPIASLALSGTGTTLELKGATPDFDRVSVSDCATTKIFGVNGTVAAGANPIPLTGNYCSAAAFAAGSSVRKLFTYYYFVADNGRGTTADPGYSLYRQKGGYINGGNAAEELLEGVEDMQLTFGVDNTGNADGVIDVYKTANNVTYAEWNGWDWVASPTPAHVEYSLVRAVRYSLLMRTSDNNLLGESQQLNFNGATLYGGQPSANSSSDRRLRQVVTSTVGIRSRVK